MVAITSQEEAAKYVPVKLTPEPAGKWRWIGTKTLQFEPDVRFPMATQYSVSVPAGTKSAIGGTLSSAKTWTFTTPAPTVKKTYPDGDVPRPLDTLMFVELDQRIDPRGSAKTIRVKAGTAQLPLRLATKEEIESDENVKELARKAEKDSLACVCATAANGDTKSAFPSNSYNTVTMVPGRRQWKGRAQLARSTSSTFPRSARCALRI